VTADAVATVGSIADAIARRDPAATDAERAGGARTLAVHTPSGSSTVLDAASYVSDAKIASGEFVQAVPVDAARAREAAPVSAILRVTGGPDTGTEFQLRRGSFVVGRDADVELRLSDPLVSKRHARVEVSDTVDVIDLNSANGIVVDGGIVTRVRAETGQTLTLGDTVITVDVLESARGVATERTGPVSFNRSPSVEPRYPGDEYEAPEIPKEIDPVPFPWAAFFAPLLVVGIMFFLIENKTMLVLLALTPIVMVGTWATQLIQQKSKLKRATAKFEQQLARLTETLDAEREREREVRDAEAPTAEALLSAAEARGPMLWSRRPEHWSFLNLRLGTGTVTSRNVVKSSVKYAGVPAFEERVEELVARYRTIDRTAVVESLASAGCLGVAGDPSRALGVVNGLFVQLASLYSPAEVSIAAIVSPQRARDFDWLKWLPHAGSPQSIIQTVHLADSAPSGSTVLAALEELIESTRAKRSETALAAQVLGPTVPEKSLMGSAPDFTGQADQEFRPKAPVLVVLISDDAPLERARANAVVERAVFAGILPIWVSDRVDSLPAAARTFLAMEDDVAPGRARVGYVRTGETYPDVEVSSVDAATALRYARSLSAVSDATALGVDDSDLPKSIALLSLLGHELADSSEAIVDRWRQNDSLHDRSGAAGSGPRRAGKLRAIVGQGTVDAFHLDLRTQGPHALVGGTTGSGKSEFLQAWVLGMAAEYSPDRVTFLFVDYKGGSAFAECVQLPHCVGLVTDLTPHLVRRALTSLRAELHFRERLFNRKKAKDLIELERRGDPECPPALVIVIDEFAALVGEVPEFVDGIVDIAQRGRSLGIHLIMATQRPAGVIKDNLRANTNLRIALRVADAADSVDVVGSSVAAEFDPAIPGRGVARSGPTRLVAFQTGYAGGHTSGEPPVPQIEIAELTFGLPTVWQEPVAAAAPEQRDSGPNDTSRLVATMVGAARTAGVPAPRKPWLDELAAVYDSARIRQRTDAELVLGVVDDAAHQSQYPVYFRPDVDGNLAVYGAGGSGKSVLLRTLAVAASVTPLGGPVHVYGIDMGAAGLRMLETLPHVGAVVDGDDTERVTRLLGMLRETIEERAERYAAVRAGSIAEYRELATAPQEPRILLLLDGGPAFRAQYEYGAGRVYTDLQQIIADGRAVGVHVVLSADRPGALNSSITSGMQRKVVLRMTEENDYGSLDVPGDVLSSQSPPGRALVDGRESQIAVFGGSPNLADQSRAIEQLAKTLRERGVLAAPGVARLEDDIPLAALPASTADALWLGVADDDLEPVAIEPTGAFLLMGPPSSGRSTALSALTTGLLASGAAARSYYVGSAKSPLRALGGWDAVATTPEAVAELARDVAELAKTPAGEGGRIAVVIEGISDFLSTPADGPLVELIKALKRGDHLVIAESETSTWSSSWPLLAEMKSSRRGFAIQPDQQEGDLVFRTSFPRAKRSEFPPGRGYLVQAGKVRRVQLARAAQGGD